MKDINIEDRLIFALDVPEVSEAKDIVSELDDSVNFYKIGMEMLMTGKYFELLDWLIKKDKKVFVDLKFFDVPETVGRTIARLSDYGATFATIHGNQALMEKASKNKNNLKILAVTALTSLDRGDLDDLGFACDVQDLVISRAKRAFEAGCDGIVSSGLEVPFIREHVDDKLIAVIAEVRNTFGENHSYLLFNEDGSEILKGQWLEARKEFHVSPFYHVKGKYKFRFIFNKNKIAVWIDYFDDKKTLLTSVVAKNIELNDYNLLKNLSLMPFMMFKVIFLIHWQALKLLLKKNKYIPKPAKPSHKITTSEKI